MALLFIGGEVEDFVKGGAGALSVTTSTLRFRSAYARCAMSIADWNSYATVSFAASSAFGVTYRYYQDSGQNTAGYYMILRDGNNTRLRLRPTTSVTSGPTTLTLEKFDGASYTSLGVTSSTIVISTLYRFDMIVDYQASGRFRLYIDGTSALDVSANLTAGGSTALSTLSLGTTHSGAAATYSEVIVTDGEDPRPLSVKTLVPNATGDTTAWTSGAFGDIDDVSASDVDLAISETANQVLAVNATGMPTGASNLSVRALKSVAYACRGASGPSKLALGVRQSSTNAFATATTLDTGYGAVSQTWTANPVTGAAFTSAEIEALQLAYRSET